MTDKNDKNTVMNTKLESEQIKLEKNIKRRNENQRQYYKINKLEISNKNKKKVKQAVRIKCRCGGTYRSYNSAMRQHMYTKRHFNYVMAENEQLNQNEQLKINKSTIDL